MRNLKGIFAICLLAILLVNCKSEFLPVESLYTISINSGDTTYSFQVQGIEEQPKIKDEVYYTWHKSNKLYTSQGGYNGQLLNGKYEEFVNKQLIKKGLFQDGSKVGSWKEWNRKGDLISVITYKKGLRSGAYKLYGQNGQVREYGNLKNGKRSGKIVYLNSGEEALAIRYQAGVPKDTVSTKKLGLF